MPVPIGCLCLSCKYFKLFENIGYYACEAFPNGIPEDVILEIFEHTKKYPNQQGNVIFEPIEKANEV